MSETRDGNVVARRSQAERRAVSTARIIDATIDCLFKLGYGGTTVTTVIEAAGCSRGAFLHHFPSKAELMLAVVKHAWELDRRYYSAWFRAHPDPVARMSHLVEASWKALGRKSGIAVLEILIACRSDAAMADLVIPAQLAIQGAVREIMFKELSGPSGLAPSLLDATLRFAEATLRGLAIDLMVTRNPAAVGPTLDLIRAAIAPHILAGHPTRQAVHRS